MTLESTITVRKNKQVVSLLVRWLGSTKVLKELLECPQINEKAATSLVTVSVIGKTRMAALNSEYRKKDSSTDVLSFELHEQGIMGELYLCPDDIAANAIMMKHSFDVEFIEIFIHGMLHLSGYDHSDKMFSWQKKLTDRILALYEADHRAR